MKVSENCNLFYDHGSLRRVNLSSWKSTDNVEIIIIANQYHPIYNRISYFYLYLTVIYNENFIFYFIHLIKSNQIKNIKANQKVQSNQKH